MGSEGWSKKRRPTVYGSSLLNFRVAHLLRFAFQQSVAQRKPQQPTLAKPPHTINQREARAARAPACRKLLDPDAAQPTLECGGLPPLFRSSPPHPRSPARSASTTLHATKNPPSF
jgi:hypothetical protein